MKYIHLNVMFLLFHVSVFAQNGPREITPETLQKILAETESEIPKLKQQLLNKGLSENELEFSLDTFRIENIASRKIDIDYSTTGMNKSVIEMKASYEVIMNKYYKKLLDSLSEDDKKALIDAQKAWIKFRDSEMKLVGTLTEEEYSGGGSIQSNIYVSRDAQFMVDRTLEIFNYYNTIYNNQ